MHCASHTAIMAKIRTTVPIDEETLEVFHRMAEVMGKSLGSTLGDWLAESRDAAQMVTAALVKAKESPARALRDLQAIAEATQARIGDMQDEMRQGNTPSERTVDAIKKAAGGKASGAAGRAPAGRRSEKR